ncbi:hypothetical protein [Garciella nitratireducens]|uniref:hypothetical protein n=1 Tax=Garciella nitratireducens TaxID=218205 RepID=UPI001BD29A90|nr:hypothetical protein [Garciella nitratireducens]
MEKLLNEIMDLSFKELQHAQQILKLTQEIRACIEKEKVKTLNQVLNLRQQWINQAEDTRKKIQEKTKELESRYSKRMEEINAKLYSHSQVENIFKNKEQRKKIYGYIYELEMENLPKAENLLKQYRKKINGLQQGKKVIQVYEKRSTTPSILLNQLK